MRFKQLIFSGIALFSLLMSSCEKIYDEAQGCGLFIDFKYDYNMLYTDAFHSLVKKVDVYVFDTDSSFLFKQSAEGSQLIDKNYRMRLNVPASESQKYIVMAWAGSIENFEVQPINRIPANIRDLKLMMHQQEDGMNNMDLGSLWYGEIRNINYLAHGEQTETVNLIKDTNRFRIILQNIGKGNSISVNDLSFRILSDNTYYNHKNEIISTHTLSYQPYFKKDVAEVGAVAELNTMRLVENNPLQLIIRDNKSNLELLNIDFMKYLLASKMEGYDMTAQEYLDRQSEFTIILFYNMVNNAPYLSAKIKVNNWVTWLQNAEF